MELYLYLNFIVSDLYPHSFLEVTLLNGHLCHVLKQHNTAQLYILSM